MKVFEHPAAIALGAATLSLFYLVGPLVSPTHMQVYHLTGSASAVFIPPVLYLCGLWLCLTLLLKLTAKYRQLQVSVWCCLLFLLPWVVTKNYAFLTGWDIPHWASVLILLLPSMTLLGAVFLCDRSFFDAFRPAQRFASQMLGVLSLLGVAILCQLLWFDWDARSLNHPAALHHELLSTHRPRGPRVIWILLDELSYQQVYGQRFPGLRLPEFDRFANEASVFTRTIPAGIYTEVAVPSLMTGLSLDDIRVSSNGMLMSMHDRDHHGWKPFDPAQTVFQDALDNGYETGVAGWYNPYCRILPSVLDRCYWANRQRVNSEFNSGESLGGNLLSPLRDGLEYVRFCVRRMADRSWDEDREYATRNKERHIDEYRDLYEAADRLLASPSVDFVLLHMPVPHPPGIFDRHKMIFSVKHSSYLDNLVLADQYLAHIRSVLEQEGEWDSSAVIVMGDHSWRTKLLWSKQTGWTREEELASNGTKFDDRPFYAVKLPGQHDGVRIDSPFPAANTRDLLDAIILNKISASEDLQKWVSSHSNRSDLATFDYVRAQR